MPHLAQRPNSSNSNKWNHDLFGPKSTSHSPALGQVSSPFGSTPPTPTTPTNAHQAHGSQHNGASRFGIKGGSKAQADANAQREQQRLAVLERQRQQRQQDEDRKARQLAEQHHATQTAIAQAEQYGFVVQVEGLVFGTSAEDVKVSHARAAFNQTRTAVRDEHELTLTYGSCYRLRSGSMARRCIASL